MKKSTCLVLSVLTLLSFSFAGCKSDKQNGDSAASNAESTSNLNELGQFPIVKDKITLKMFATQNPQISDFSTNEATKYLEEKTNIHIEFQTAPSDSAQEKVNLMLSSGDYPDIFMNAGLNAMSETKYGVDEKVLIPLDDLLDKNSVEIKKLMNEHPQIKGVITAVDGHIYGLPSFNDCYHCQYSQKMWINTSQLDKLGLKMPTTTDELYQVLKTFKEKVPGAIPLAGATNGWWTNVDYFLMNPFIFTSGTATRIYVKDNKIDTAANKEEYKQGLEYLNKLYKEGLLYDGSFTQKTDQLKQLIADPNEPVLCVPGGANVNWIDINATPETYKHYVTLAPLKGPNNVQQTIFDKYQPIGQMVFAVTKACKNPDAAVRWFDSLYNFEVFETMNIGQKGRDWTDPQSGDVGLDGKPALLRRIRQYSNEPQNVNWQDFANVAATAERRFGEAVDPNVDKFSAPGLERLLFDETKEKYEPYASKEYEVAPPLKFTSEETTELQTITVELEKYITESRTKFIMGTSNLESDWDTYVKGLNDIGLEKYLEIQQKAYDRQFK